MFELMSVNHSARTGGKAEILFRFSLNYMKVYRVFSFESPHRGDSNECTQYTIFNIEKKIALIYPKSAGDEIFPRDSRTSSKQPW